MPRIGYIPRKTKQGNVHEVWNVVQSEAGQIRRYAWLRPVATLLLMVVLVTVFAPSFWDPPYLLKFLRQNSEIGILATGMTLVIISGGIDLSVGSLLALSATLFAYAFARKGLSPALAMALALGSTTAFGLINGVMITRLRMQPFVVTLASMIGARGFARWLVSNYTIDIGFGQEFPARLVRAIAHERVVVPVFLVVAAVGLVLLNWTRFGRYVLSVGGNEEAARLSGIRVGSVKVRVYLLSSFFAGIAGILHCCQNRQGNPNDGIAYELDAIAAAVIGGTSLAGGKGGIFGTFVGALALGILVTLLRLRGLDENVQWMLKAVIILSAVGLQMIGTRKSG